MEAQHPDTFNQRMSQWIANQGFWFQLRYSMSGGGGWSVAFFHLMRMIARVAIVLLLAGIVFFIFLTKRSESAAFKEGMRVKFEEAIGASEAKIFDFKRVQGVATIRRLGAEGTPSSFFDSLEAGNLRFKMSLLDGLTKEWKPGVVQANWIDAEVKGGANSPEDAAQAVRVMFNDYPGFKVDGLDVTNARISWGYSDRTYGQISGSKLAATRIGGSWRLIFRGGTFTQNWIKDFEIAELVFLLREDGLEIERGSLRAGKDGWLDFKDVEVKGGEYPEISGTLVLRSIPIAALIPRQVQSRMAGSVSGELTMSGSTNSPDGVVLEGTVNLDGEDLISIRDDFQLLETLDVVDVFNNYKRVDFDKGSFHVKTGGGQMTVSQLNIEAGDMVSLQGRLTVRQPTKEEAARQAGLELADVENPLYGSEESRKAKDAEISLRQAAEEAKRDQEVEGGADLAESREFFANMQKRKEDEARIRREASERYLNTLIFDGGFRMTIPGDAFDRSQVLRERFPVDPATGRIGIDVPLEGSLFTLTVKQAEEIYRLGVDGD